MKSNFLWLIFTAFIIGQPQLSWGQGDGYTTVGLYDWMSTNLNVSVFSNGDSIPEARTPEEWRNAWMNEKPAWSYYQNDPENGKKYGKLYNWYAINDPRGLSPEGWYVPTNDEWEVMISELGGAPGKKLKATESWMNKGNGTDSVGLGVYPSGVRYIGGGFDDMGERAYFWSSTSISENRALYRVLRDRSNDVETIGLYSVLRKGAGMSVRVVRRTLYDNLSFKPANVPNDGVMFVDHESTGRSGHVGLALTECKNGDILAFYMNTNGKIWDGHGSAGWTEYKRSTDGGRTWSEPTVLKYSKRVWDENTDLEETWEFRDFYNAYVSSVVTLDNGDLLAMISQRVPGGADMKWQRKPVYIISKDNGFTWSEPQIIDENASIEEVSLTHNDGGTVVYNGVVYSVFIGELGFGEYSLYASKNNGKSFEKINDHIFAERSWEENFYYAAIGVIEEDKLIIYGYNQEDEHNVPYIVSEDGGYTWSDIKTTYLEKRVRSAQFVGKIGDKYFMSGRSGNFGEDPFNLVLYTSRDGIHWDRGRYLNKEQRAIDSYSAMEIVGKYDQDKPKKLLIHASIGYGVGSRTNVKQWWVESISKSN